MAELTHAGWERGHDMCRASIAYRDRVVADLEQQLAKARRDRDGQVQVLLDGLTNYVQWLRRDQG